MAFSPLKTVRMRDQVAWSATKRRRKAAKQAVEDGTATAPTTVNDGSKGSPAGSDTGS